MLCGLDLPLGLLLPLLYYVFDVAFLLVQLLLDLLHVLVDPVDLRLQLIKLRVDPVAERVLQLLQIRKDVLVHDLVGLHPPLLLGLEYVLDLLQPVLHLLHLNIHR